MSGNLFSGVDDKLNLSEGFDQGSKGVSNTFEGLNHAPVDNTMRFMDNHGETVTKAAIIAGLIYGMGGFGGGGGGGGSGGVIPSYGQNALQNFSKFGGNMNMNQQQPQQINPILAMMLRQQQPDPNQPPQYAPISPGVLSQYMG